MPIGPMGEPLPYNNGPPVGNPMGGPQVGGPGGGPQDEVAQLLQLRDQIDQRLSELMGGQMPGADQMAAAGGIPGGVPGGMPPGLLTA
jgi:hypothetical protein